MDINNIFSTYNTTEFRNINEQYYQGKIDANNLVIQLLNQVK